VGKARRDERGVITVLLVDDHPIIDRGLRTILTQPENRDLMLVGGRTMTAEDAILKARELRPDVVVFDLIPDETTGSVFDPIVVLSEISAVLVYTGRENVVQQAAAAIRAGALGVLLKGVEIERIGDFVRAVASNELTIDPAIEQQVHEILAQDPPRQLTFRENDVLLALKRGLSDEDIGVELEMSVATVRTHIRNAMRKLGVHSRLHLVLGTGHPRAGKAAPRNGSPPHDGEGSGETP
jgi:DNA-binding NarL/FixJ family response regulator